MSGCANSGSGPPGSSAGDASVTASAVTSRTAGAGPGAGGERGKPGSAGGQAPGSADQTSSAGCQARAEPWRWAEESWRDPAIDLRQAVTLTAGVDVGSVSSQAAVLADDSLLAWASMRTGASSPESARRVMSRALAGSGLSAAELHFVVGTGYGRVNVPFAHQSVTEIQCHARGACFMYGPAVRTVLDMGGQDCKAIRCDESGKVVAFEMNERCAAGTGRGLEVFADLLQVPIADIGPLSLSVDEEPAAVSSTCVVFARTEATALLRRGWSRERVLAAYCGAMARRVVLLLERVGVARELAITGGIAKNTGVVRRIERLLKVQALSGGSLAARGLDSQIAGALGAALIARTLELRRRAGGT